MTTSAAKPKRLPPLTTFDTRLMWTSLSTNSLSRSSRSLLRSRPPRSRSPAMVFSNLWGLVAPVLFKFQISLEAEPALARGIRERLDAPVEQIAAAVEHDFLDTLLHGALGKQLADRLGRVDIRTGLAGIAQGLLQRRGGSHRLALQIVDDLCVDVLRRAEHAQARTAIGRTAQRKTDALLAPGIRNIQSRHDPLRYFFLPSLRKMNSPAYFTPLPL